MDQGRDQEALVVSDARVLIADDDALVRGWIRRALEEDGRFVVCAETADASTSVAAAVRERPDICLLDIRMPANGLAAAREISSRLPETKVVMLTVSDDDDDLFAALRAGAAGYILKRTEPSALGDALQSVLRSEVAFAPELVARIVEEFRDSSPRRRSVEVRGVAERMTTREWEVLDLLRRNQSTAQIAARLFVSHATVRSHVAAILRKLDVPDRAAAVRLFSEGAISGHRTDEPPPSRPPTSEQAMAAVPPSSPATAS
jgi:DNA-binding NarL/FixJ family response regulator